jgi:acetyl-CoA carboxylase, biotin carboxylase subunit
VEFIVDGGGNHYFIEMNARIQVEHPVTEMVTGIDLIKAQILVAAGEELPFRQEDIRPTGVALECRINAEDPDKNFRPTPGAISKLRVPGGFGVRFDSHVHEGYTVSQYYDSMIGKLIVHQPTRAETVACMKRALAELHIEGVKTTIPLYLKILDHSAFNNGQVDTTFIERTWLS